jgi:hypothetical protein
MPTPLRPRRKEGGSGLRKPGGSRSNVVLGLLLLARGRRDALTCFEGTRDGFLAALSPWIAFLLVWTALAMARHPSSRVALLSLLSLCALLLPPVLTHALARRWKREDRWLRYATASVWSGWLMVLAYVPVLMVVALLLQAGVGQMVASIVLAALLGSYWFWLHWFLGRHGLGVGNGRALFAAASVAIASVLMLFLADWLPPHVAAKTDLGAAQTPPAAPAPAPKPPAPTHPNGSGS